MVPKIVLNNLSGCINYGVDTVKKWQKCARWMLRNLELYACKRVKLFMIVNAPCMLGC